MVAEHTSLPRRMRESQRSLLERTEIIRICNHALSVHARIVACGTVDFESEMTFKVGEELRPVATATRLAWIHCIYPGLLTIRSSSYRILPPPLPSVLRVRETEVDLPDVQVYTIACSLGASVS